MHTHTKSVRRATPENMMTMTDLCECECLCMVGYCLVWHTIPFGWQSSVYIFYLANICPKLIRFPGTMATELKVKQEPRTHQVFTHTVSQWMETHFVKRQTLNVTWYCHHNRIKKYNSIHFYRLCTLFTLARPYTTRQTHILRFSLIISCYILI